MQSQILFLLLATILQTCLGSGLYESTVEAHGPLARLALHTIPASGPLQYYPSAATVRSAGVTLAAVPVAPTARAAPLTHVSPLAVTAPLAAVDVLHHIPSVADIPITKYSTFPGYIQRYVDVPTAQIAKAKLQVRRPAIHKQFYDIEKRTVVRPLGSAVVELDEPISKNLVSPFAVVPGGYHTVAQYQPVSSYPSSPYPFVSYAPFQTPVQAGQPVFLPQSPVIAQYPQLAQRPVIAPQPPQQYPIFPPQQPLQPVPQPPQQYPTFQPQQPSQPPQQYPTFPPRPQQPAPVPPQQFPQPSNPSTENVENTNEEFDDSDTVVIENPEFSRSSSTNQQNDDNTNLKNREQSITNIQEKDIDNDETSRTIDVINELQSRQLLREYMRNNDLQPFQLKSILPLQQLKNNLDEKAKPAQSPQESDTTTEEETKSDEIDNSETLQQNFFRAAIIPPLAVERAQIRTYTSQGQIASVRNLTPEENQENQRKLIELLTGSGDVTEIGTSRSGVKISSMGDAGVVRGRVISVTAAPDVTGQGTERVSTRRVVVTRPIQTLEEVDVHQPITKLERLSVHEPAVLETAHPSIARVPTAVPYVSRTLAPAHPTAYYHL